MFALALGIAAGTVARRTLPAIAVVLGGFIALRLVISDFLRPHYLTAITTYYSVTCSFTPRGQAWVLAQGAVSRTGLVVSGATALCIRRFRPPARSCFPATPT